MNSRANRPVLFAIPLLIGACLVSCVPQARVTPTPGLELGEWLSSPTQSIQPPPTVRTESTPEPVAGDSQILVYLSPDASPNIDQPMRDALSELAKQSNLSLVETSQISPADLKPETRLIVLSAEPSDLKDLLDAAPHTRFLALTQTSLDGAPNLISLQTTNLQPDQVDFLAGFIAASSTPHWRVGVISMENTPSERAFTNGAVFFCGLCRPPFPPFEQYPQSATISGGAGNWQSAVDGLLAEGGELQTIYVAPGAGSEELYTFLARKGIHIISTQPMPQNLKDQWVVSLIAPDPTGALKTMWASLISPDPATPIFSAATIFQNVNPAYFSTGRQRLAQELLLELESDAVSSGVQ